MGVTVTPSFDQLRNKPTTVAGFGISDMANQTCGAVPFSGVTGKPTTMTGYGITDEKCKAWVNFNGTGVVAIRAAFNVSSITDLAVGNYTVNFNTAMTDTNYAAIVSPGDSFGGAGLMAGAGQTKTTTTCSVNSRQASSAAEDMSVLQLAIFR